MIYQFGTFFIIAIFASVKSASQGCICTREMNPVCGSNGRTYNNLCLLECQQKSDPSLVLEHLGSCRTPRAVEATPCICTLEYKPVCGSDGRTYGNKCAMGCQGGNIEVAHQGECRRRTKRSCDVCTLEYNPLCGTDGRTYGNQCQLDCAEGNVRVAYQGECRNKRDAENETPVCFCTYEFNPVCGDNGRTYGNPCALRCEGGRVKMAHPGECREKRDTENETPPCVCTLEHNPVCGDNGQTYGNPCALGCENGQVKMAHPGECRHKRESVQIAKLSPCLCTREARPVCGNDGKTYSNPCLLNCAREQNENLHIEHPGPCIDQGRPQGHSISQPSCSCTRQLAPVCASNGVTYNNECLMRCADQDLTVEKYEPCDN